MSLTAQQKDRIASLAKELISGMRAVELSAQEALRHVEGRPAGAAALGWTPNPMVGPAHATLHLERMRQHKLQEFTRLRSEPFVAHVLAEDENGRRQRFYFSRAIPPQPGAAGLNGTLTTTRTPLGKLAEVPVGESVDVPLPEKRCVTYTVLEHVRLRPTKAPEGWDGREDRIHVAESLVTLDSLLEFLSQLEPETAPLDLLEELRAAAEAAATVHDGIRRGVIARMSLRDQAVLDQYQGEVFRLPMNRRLMLSGPPGTGKTTTLIRRLAQKRNIDEIGESDREVIPPERLSEFFHTENWIMFTPTELLKLYLKEAFACEGIAASDERVRTWASERRRLSRDVLRILRSERGGRFTLAEDALLLLDETSGGSMALADAFVAFVEQELVRRYERTFEELSTMDEPELSALLSAMRARAGGDSIVFEHLFELVEFHEALRQHVDRLSGEANETYRVLINSQLANDRSFADRLADFLDTVGLEDDEDDEEEESEGDDDRVTPARDRRLQAADAFRRAMFARAVALEEARSLGRTSRNARIIEWLGVNLPADTILKPLGAKLVVLRRLRFLANTYRNLIDGIPVLYQRFRRHSLREGHWYRSDARSEIDRRRVGGAEVDTVLYVMLRHSRKFLLRSAGRSLREDTRIATLEAVKAQYVTQVLVDEATDFSPVQLACILELANPMFRSCFICGDVLQRVTRWGVRDVRELPWVSADFEIREVGVAYRQSRRLVALTAAVAGLSGGQAPILSVPDYTDDANIPPLLGEHLTGEALGRWLRDRIIEIERTLAKVPSIAIFVDGDSQVDALVDLLRPLLAERNLDVVGCKEGRVVGAEAQIRVFDVQYVKGLEFEAVFFVGVDTLVSRHDELFRNFLFVGTTRAATYLGLTCEQGLPPSLAPLHSQFETGAW
jgi:hypothetical protein